MCGILFTVNTSTHTPKLEDFMKDAFTASMLRGTDSTGVFQVQNSYHPDGPRNVKIHKSIAEGASFVNEQGAKEIINATNRLPVTVGHVRAATNGAVSVANAHPFVTVREDGSRIVGVHNGSLIGWRGKSDAAQFDVDSQWLYHKLAKDGYDAFKGIEGAYALVWFDSRKPESLFVARNKERPLFYAYTKGGTGMIAASELGMLGWLADRNRMELEQDTNGNSFFFPSAGHVFEFNIKDLNKWTKTAIPEFDNKFRGYDRPWTNHYPARSGYPSYAAPRSNGLAAGHVADVNYNVNNAWQLTAQNSKLRAISNALAVGRTKSLKSGNALLDNAIERIIEAEKAETDQVIDGAQLEAGLDSEIQTFLEKKENKQLALISEDVNDIVWGDSDSGNSPSGTSGTKGIGGAGTEAASSQSATDEKEFQFLSHPPSASASPTEVTAAKSLGIYGLVVQFCGYMLDTETNEVYGDFRTIEKGKVMSYDGIVRGQSSQAADLKYIYPNKLIEMVVVGITQPKKDQKPYMVLADKPRGAAFTTAAARAKATA